MSATPDEQAKQILDIYPVLDAKTTSEITSAQTEQPLASEPKSSNAAGGGGGGGDGGGDLIDFGSDSAAPANPSNDAAPAKRSNDVEGMLAQTGKPASDGPLLDFTDMKKDLP
jgi:hypothetical protein